MSRHGSKPYDRSSSRSSRSAAAADGVGHTVDDYLRHSRRANHAQRGWFGRIKSYVAQTARYLSGGQEEDAESERDRSDEEEVAVNAQQQQTRRASLDRQTSAATAPAPSPIDAADDDHTTSGSSLGPVMIPAPTFAPMKWSDAPTAPFGAQPTPKQPTSSFAQPTAASSTAFMSPFVPSMSASSLFGASPLSPLSPASVSRLSRSEKERLFVELQRELIESNDSAMPDVSEEKENSANATATEGVGQGYFAPTPAAASFPYTPSTAAAASAAASTRKRAARSWEADTAATTDATPRKQNLLFSPYGRHRPTSTPGATPSAAALQSASNSLVAVSTSLTSPRGAAGSATATRILQTLDRLSTPLLDAKKIRMAPTPKPILAIGNGSATPLGFAPSAPSRRGAQGATPQHLRGRFDPLRKSGVRSAVAPSKDETPQPSGFKITVTSAATSKPAAAEASPQHTDKKRRVTFGNTSADASSAVEEKSAAPASIGFGFSAATSSPVKTTVVPPTTVIPTFGFAKETTTKPTSVVDDGKESFAAKSPSQTPAKAPAADTTKSIFAAPASSSTPSFGFGSFGSTTATKESAPVSKSPLIAAITTSPKTTPAPVSLGFSLTGAAGKPADSAATNGNVSGFKIGGDAAPSFGGFTTATTTPSIFGKATTPAKEAAPKKAAPPTGDCAVCGMSLEDVDHSDCQDDAADGADKDEEDEKPKAISNPFASGFGSSSSTGGFAFGGFSAASTAAATTSTASASTTSPTPAKPSAPAAFSFNPLTSTTPSIFAAKTSSPVKTGFAFGAPAAATKPAAAKAAPVTGDCAVCGMSLEDVDHSDCQEEAKPEIKEAPKPAAKKAAPLTGDCAVCGMSLEDVDHSDCQDDGADGADKDDDDDDKPASKSAKVDLFSVPALPNPFAAFSTPAATTDAKKPAIANPFAAFATPITNTTAITADKEKEKEKPAITAMPSFGFAAPSSTGSSSLTASTTSTATAGGFGGFGSFGSTTTKPADSNSSSSSSTGFSFSAPSGSGGFSIGVNSTAKPTSSATTSTPAATTGFGGFGATTTSSTATTAPTTTLAGFGDATTPTSFSALSAPAAASSSAAAPFFTAPAAASSAPAFGFGAASTPSSTTTSLGFGATSAPKPAETTLPSFGAAPSSAGPTFGGAAPSSVPSFGAPASAGPTFGGAATAAPSFGATSAASPFGTTASVPSFGAAASTPAFGAPPAASPFGAPAASTPSFGAPAASTPSFGAPAASTPFASTPFGAPSAGGAVSNPFGTAAPAAAPSSAGFGFSAPSSTPSFGAAPAAQSTPFQAAPSSTPFGGFGATAPSSSPFGAAPAAPSSFGFSAPTPAAAPSFGGAGFSSFGGAAPAPAPAQGGFNAPAPAATGGFTTGTRTIIKAKRRGGS